MIVLRVLLCHSPTDFLNTSFFCTSSFRSSLIGSWDGVHNCRYQPHARQYCSYIRTKVNMNTRRIWLKAFKIMCFRGWHANTVRIITHAFPLAHQPVSHSFGASTYSHRSKQCTRKYPANDKGRQAAKATSGVANKISLTVHIKWLESATR